MYVTVIALAISAVHRAVSHPTHVDSKGLLHGMVVVRCTDIVMFI
jgi:hypothetical protein